MADGHHLILDAGTGLRGFGRQLASWPPIADGPRIMPLLLSHRHSDHVIGLSNFVPLVQTTTRVRIACGDITREELEPFVIQQLSEPLFPAIDGLLDAVEVRDFDELNTFTVSAACHVVALAANHPGGASVLRVDDPNGPVLAYAPDNELAMDVHDPELAVWRAVLRDSLQGIPLLLHDATYIGEELEAHRGWGHSSAEEATQFAMDCEAGTLLLMHHHPDRDDDAIDAMVVRCQTMVAQARSSLRVMAAFDGMTHTVE